MVAFKNIKKRDGQIVDFDVEKIRSAIQKAFVAVAGAYSDDKIDEIINAVSKELETVFAKKEPGVEDVQDAVERSLMTAGFFAVAKAYILYRYEHEKTRVQAESTEREIEKNKVSVVKRTGQKEPFDLEKIKRVLAYATKGLESDIDTEKIIKQCQSEVYDGMPTSDIARSLSMAARALIEQEPAYSKVAARLLMGQIYKEVIGPDVIDFNNLEQQHTDAFVSCIENGVKIGRLDKRMLDYDLKKYVSLMNLENDELFEYMGLEVMYNRYLVKDPETDKAIETPQMLWLRVALGTALLEKKSVRDQVIEDFYYVLAEFLYTPGGRTLFHAGTPHPQLSSCFLNTVPDDLHGIFKTYADNAQLMKWSGGMGTDWTDVRATGALIKGTGVGSQGVIPFLKIANDVTVSINRSGKRRGATAVYLESWHHDVIDFLELRKNTGDERRRAHDMNTANWIPDLFMKRVKEDGQWTLFSPHEVPELHDLYGKAFEQKYEEYERKAAAGEMKLFRTMPAKDLWRKMLAMLFETGHPWITFKDPCNVRSPQDHVGVVHNSNLCTEITLNTSYDETAVCNLGSLNFAKFVTDGKFNEEKVARVVRTAIRMLDNVIDLNFYPTEDAKRANLRHRPLGLGVRGFQDALYMLGIDFDSEECVRFADESMETVAYYAILASSELAKDRGTYETYKGSKWDRNIFPQDTLDLLEQERGQKIPVARGGRMDWTEVREHVKKHGMRNSNTMAIAPTASTANLVGCVPTIEPIYKNLYVKSNKEGNFVVINKYLVQELKDRGLWNEDVLGRIKFYDGSIQQIESIPEDIRAKYKEVFEIDQKWLIQSAAHRGKWMDQSQSLNIFFHGTSGKELSEVYFTAWEYGLKTTYYLRTMGASQVEKSTMDTQKFGVTHKREGSKTNTTGGGSPQEVQPQGVPVPQPQAQPAAPVMAATETAQKPATAAAAGAATAGAATAGAAPAMSAAESMNLSKLMMEPACDGCEG